MSGELGRDLVPGKSLINKFFLCQPGRAGGMMLGGHVHVSQACLRVLCEELSRMGEGSALSLFPHP